jgi:hypothetical protein
MKFLPLFLGLLFLAACSKPTATGTVSATFLANGKEKNIPSDQLQAVAAEAILSNETHTRVFQTTSLTPPYAEWAGRVTVGADPEKRLVSISYAGKTPEDALHRTKAVLEAVAAAPIPGELNGEKGTVIFDIVTLPAPKE